MNRNVATRKKICFVATVEWPLKMFLREQLRALSDNHEIVIVVNTDDPLFLERRGVKARIVPFRILREISPVVDAISLIRLIFFLIRERFDVVHSINPKSGLIAMIASFIARVPVRVHTFTGQVWATHSGVMRMMLKGMDQVVAALATKIVTDSYSQLDFLRSEGVLSENKGFVPGRGSVGGVDISRFSFDQSARVELRRRFGIPEDGVVFLFIGRMNRDKGLVELAQAFQAVAGTLTTVYLLIVGPDEKGMKDKVLNQCALVQDRVHFVEYTDTPERYMSASDVLCLPSHREGFGMVVIEAAAVGIPSIGSRIYGLTDAIVEGETGLFHNPGDGKGLGKQMMRLATHPQERFAMGEAARLRARKDFSQEAVTAAMLRFYDVVLGLTSTDERCHL